MQWDRVIHLVSVDRWICGFVGVFGRRVGGVCIRTVSVAQAGMARAIEPKYTGNLQWRTQ